MVRSTAQRAIIFLLLNLIQCCMSWSFHHSRVVWTFKNNQQKSPRLSPPSALAAASPLFRRGKNDSTELRQVASISEESLRKHRWTFTPSQDDTIRTVSRRQRISNGIRWSMDAYNKVLIEKPIRTKSVTSAIILAMGDIVAQFLEASSGAFILNRARLWGFILAGLVYEGPWLHFWYEKLDRLGDWMKERFNAGEGLQVAGQLLVEETFGVAFYFPLYFYVYEILCSIGSGSVPSIACATLKMKAELVDVVIKQFYVWPIANYIMFRHVPSHLRVAFNNFISFFWNAYLCSRVA